jgi:hypothetical protein
MRLGELLVEAKLTESDFQSANIGLISRYRDLETVFHIEELLFDEWEAQQLPIDSRYACGARTRIFSSQLRRTSCFEYSQTLDGYKLCEVFTARSVPNVVILRHSFI